MRPELTRTCARPTVSSPPSRIVTTPSAVGCASVPEAVSEPSRSTCMAPFRTRTGSARPPLTASAVWAARAAHADVPRHAVAAGLPAEAQRPARAPAEARRVVDRDALGRELEVGYAQQR